MSQKKIVVVNPNVDHRQKEQIIGVAGKYDASVEFYKTVEEAIPNLAGAEIVFGISPDLIKNAPDIKWFCSASAGIDHYVKAGCFDGRDIILTNSSGSFGLTISEYIIMMALIMMRRMPEYGEFIRAHSWKSNLENKSLFGSKIVVLGTGNLGSMFAKRVRGFEPKSLIGVSRSGNHVDLFDRVEKTDKLPELLSDVDLLVMCLPGTPETEGILSKELIDSMPSSSYIINVGRGSAIDIDALVTALEEGRIAGATLDVLPKEPLPEDSYLWDVKNLIITPHMSGQETMPWTRDNNYNMFCEDIENYFEGRKMAHLADPKLGY